LLKDLTGENHLGGLGVGGRMKEVGRDNVDWIHRNQDRLPQQVLLNTIMKYLRSIHPEHYTFLIQKD
jgi:hypothetical protein